MDEYINSMEEHIMEQVTTWFYEDIVNDILGLRRNIILAPNDEPCRYFIERNKIYSRIDNYRRYSIKFQMRYDKKKLSVNKECHDDSTHTESYENPINKEQYNNSMDILCKSIATLSDLIERISIHQGSVKKCDYRKIKSYFKEMTETGLEELNEMYQYYNKKNKDEILEIFNDKLKTDEILNEVIEKIPQDKICIMYHYYRYHTEYNRNVYMMFEKMLLKNISCVYKMTTIYVDEIMKEVQLYLSSNKNVGEWHKEIYSNAIEISKAYTSLSKIIPPKKRLISLIKKFYKIWEDKKIEKGKSCSEYYKNYTNTIKELTKENAIVPIIKKGKTSKYSGDDVNSMELRTLHNTFFPYIEESFGLNNKNPKIKDKYTCPEFMIKEFIQLCENSYTEDIHKKKGTYLNAYKEKGFIEKIVRLYIGFFIMYSFDKNMYTLNIDDCEDIDILDEYEDVDFVTFINNCRDKSGTEILLKYFIFLAEMEEEKEKFEDYATCIEIINDILKHRN